MNRQLSSFGWRKVVILSAGILIAAGALAVMVAGGRDRAIAAAKKYGQVDIDPSTNEVRRIDLHSREAFDEVLPLLRSVPDLQFLSLGGAELQEKNLQAIAELQSLPTLFMVLCDLDDDDMRFLEKLTDLRELRIAKNPITDEGLRHLAPLKSLEVLDLGHTRVSGSGLQLVTPSLKNLCLSGTLMDDQSIVHCTRFKTLNRLSLDGTRVTETGLMKLTDLHWLALLGTPDGIPRAALRQFRAKYLESLENAAAMGEEVPPPKGRLAPYE